MSRFTLLAAAWALALLLAAAQPAARGDRGEGCPSFPTAVSYGVGEDRWSVAMGDLDADGDVDLTDLAALLSVYGTTCP